MNGFVNFMGGFFIACTMCAFIVTHNNNVKAAQVTQSQGEVTPVSNKLKNITPRAEVCIGDWVYYEFDGAHNYTTYAPKIDYGSSRFTRCP